MKHYTLGSTGAAPRVARVDFDAELNEAQREVVFAGDGPLLVIAGAGSGKTRTLTYRVSRLVESGTPIGDVLLVTFTNKAAREMLRRAENLLQIETRRMWAGTFHHVGHLVLRRYSDLIGFDKGTFTILDRADSKELMDSVISGRKELSRHRKFPKGDVLEEILSFSINTGTPADRVIMERYPVFGDIIEDIRSAFREYEARKRKRNCMDFDDLLVNWRRLIVEFPDVRERLRERFRHILVDEYQDTNRLQAEIVESIAGPEGNLLVVGDDAQSIYSFRGANFGNIIDFPKRFPTCRIFKLERNYRSTPDILRLSNHSIRHNQRQFAKDLFTERPAGALPEVVSTQAPFEQAKFVAERIADLREEGYELRDIAVLYRAHWHSMELQMELGERGIPFQVRSGARFFEQAHVKDVLAHLRLTTNPKDELSWKRVLKLCTGIGRATADKIFAKIEEQPDAAGAVLSQSSEEWVPRPARESWKSFRRLYERLLDPATSAAPQEAIRAVIESGYLDTLQAIYTNAPGRMDDLQRMADYARRYESVQQFVDEVTVANPIAGQDTADEAEPTDQLILSTVHQAKGLEWRAVFMIWLVDGKLPDARSIKEPGGEEEERRLFYVACTRAKDRLFLVHPTMSDERGRFLVPQRVSRFVHELEESTYERAYAD